MLVTGIRGAANSGVSGSLDAGDKPRHDNRSLFGTGHKPGTGGYFSAAPDQALGVLAVPFGGAEQAADLAAFAVEQQGGRQAGGAQGGRQARGRDRRRARASRPWSPRETSWAPAKPVRSTLTATTSNWSEPISRCSRSRRRHLLAAGQAPGRPQVEEHHLAAPVGQRALACPSRPGTSPRAGPRAPCGTRRPPSAPGSGDWCRGRPAPRPASRLARKGACRRRTNGVVRTAQRHVYACEARDRGDRRRAERRDERRSLGAQLRLCGLASFSLARVRSCKPPEGNLVTDKNANKMWGGRFSMSPAEIMQEINASIGFDKALAPQDIRASKAHAAMLAAQGIISKDDARKINAGLDRVLEEIEAGRFQFSRALEDVHMNVESRLEELIGEPAAAAAYRALAQRPGGDRLQALRARLDRRRGCRARRTATRARAQGRGPLRHDHAGLHASAAGPARDLRPPSAGLRRDAGARSRPARRCTGAAQRVPARRRRAGRHVLSHRPAHDGRGAGLRPAGGQLARRSGGPRLRAGDAGRSRHHRHASVPLCRGDRASG